MNVGCFVVVVVVVIDTIVCLVRKVAFFCLKLVKEFVLNSRVSALLHFFHINKLQKCRGLLRYRSESKWQNVSVPRKFLHFTEFANSKRALTLSLDIVIDPVPLELYNIHVEANNFRPF